MGKLTGLEPIEVFKYFEEICSIPHGSGNMKEISDFCLKFADKHGLKALRDNANNVVIYKNGTGELKDAEPVILQGHIDMVCQKTDDSSIDFEKDGLSVKIEDGFVTADGTTLGADNGIAVAMIMAVLASETLTHPPIEAVFTTDEEIGMIGAEKLDTSVLNGKRMINLDSEESETLVVSCAGGCDFKAFIPYNRVSAEGTKIVLSVKGLQGGHSGTEIDKGRINANILMGRLLNYADKK